MPRDRRSSTARADNRPAFARPPGARAPPAEPSPPAPARRKRRNDDDPSDDLYDSSPRRSTPKRTPKEKARASPAASPEKKRPHGRDRHKRKISEPPTSYDIGDTRRDRAKYSSGTSTASASQLLSVNALAKLNEENDLDEFDRKRKARKQKEKAYKTLKTVEVTEKKRRRKNRDVSGAMLEEGRGGKRRKGSRGHTKAYDDYVDEKRYSKKKKTPIKKKWWLIGGLAVVVLIIIIAAAVAASKGKSNKSSGGSSAGNAVNSTATIQNTCKNANVPASAKGTYTDVTQWLDTTDFNCTWTNETIGGLSVMGLNSTWDDTTRANSNTTPLNKAWAYGTVPIRGINVGGWFSLEPFITPSLFNYPSVDNVVDEWTLSQKLGSAAASTLENHYATFITKADFEAMKAAGFDHVRVPYSYWAVRVYEGDPYVPQIAWRYLLRAIEWARECGLRVNLDLHGVPGSQNGWAHSGHQGAINWLNGPDGDLYGNRSVEIHNQLSQFFAQDRYKNVITLYGLVNEPRMILMDEPDRVLTWNKQVISLARSNGINQIIVFGDGFYPLTYWNDTFKNVDPNLMLDTHQYQIFNTGQLQLTHQDKINLACSGWTGLITASNNNVTGWGPTLNGEWSQADTDCTPNLNNVGVGTRWAGTFDPGNGVAAVTTPSCASAPDCSCNQANADPSTYNSAYQQMLQMYAEAQMHSFEQGQGWFYWTWKTENAAQWSWQLGLQAGTVPDKAYSPTFKCAAAVPDFSGLPESY